MAAAIIGLLATVGGFGLAMGGLSALTHHPISTPGDGLAPATTGQEATTPTSGVEAGVVDVDSTLLGGSAAGTGMVISASGDILTNNHVIEGATSIHVQIDGGGQIWTASVVGEDPAADVALLRIAGASHLSTVPLGDSSTARVGDPVTAMGNALGRSGPPAVSQGVITALDRSITAGDDHGSSESLAGLIQIDAPIQPGDSGGPLIDRGGRVIGMNTAADIGFRRLTGSRVAFAIPINLATSIADRIRSGREGGGVHIGPTAFLGVGVVDSPGGGALIGQVEAGSPAQAAGLAPRDVITELGGTSVTSAAALGPAVRSHRPGDRVDVRWLDTAGRHHSAAVSLASGPPA